MRTTSYLALSRQAALERQMATVANNLANATTTGYRAEHMVFEETPAPRRPPAVAFVQDVGLRARPVAGADHADRQPARPRDRRPRLPRLRQR